MTVKEEKDSFSREYFAKMGRRGGKVSRGNLTPEQRKASARKAANARWAKKKES